MEMEELRRLEKFQSVVSAITSHGFLSSDSASSLRFLSSLVLLLVQPCDELDMDSKLALASDFLPKVTGPFLEEISMAFQGDDEAKPTSESKKSNGKRSVMDKVEPYASQIHQEVVPMVGLDAMKRANSTLEDFSRSYFMFHGLEINEPQSIFRYLPVLSFTESYIYQVDALNEKIVSDCGSRVIYSSHGWNAESQILFETDPLKPLGDLLEREGLFTQRIEEEFKSGKEYWELERKLCHALSNKNKVNGLHMDFLSISEFLVEVADDLFDYEDDVLENHFNVLRMFVGIFGPSNAPTELAKRISEAEEKYEEIMKSLDPHLSSKYQRRCEEATKEGGKISGHSLGTWNIPAVISDEESYRATQQ